MPDRKYGSFAELIESCHALTPLRTAVVYPCEKVALAGINISPSLGGG
jgi:hypothetical protein